MNRQFATENDIKNIQTAITFVKNMRLSKSEIEAFDVEIAKFPVIYECYQKELRAMNKIDYDDQVVYALRILEQFPEVRSYFQTKYQYFCIDEAQDTSKIQHDMIALLASKSGNIFMVGDEDQSIYGFRAAYPEALVSFEQQHPHARTLFMESNYRSREEIVQVADRFIQANQNRHKKQMNATRKEGGQVTNIAVKTRKKQFDYLYAVAKECNQETAILYRNNESILPLIDLLERNEISYQMKKNDMTFFSHPVVRDLCDILMFAKNPYDDELFLRIYYKMGAGISKKNVMQAIESNRRKKTLLQEISDAVDVSTYTKKRCRTLNTHFQNIMHESVGKAIYRILQFMGYQEYMESRCMDSKKAEILKILGEQEETIDDFLNRLDQLKEIVETHSNQNESLLLLSTIHSSKGLEYSRVYLIDVIKGILPSIEEPRGKYKNPTDVALFEEERRLFYVGMTRAKEELFIFTFDEKENSEFLENIFDIKKRRIMEFIPYEATISGQNIKQNYRIDYTNSFDNKYEKEYAQYKVGVLVNHKKFGQGVVVAQREEVVEILFKQEQEPREMMLGIALKNGMLRVIEK